SQRRHLPPFPTRRSSDRNPRPFATAYGQPCQDPGFTLDLAPGDSPEPGAVHRLQASVPNAAALTFSVLGFSHTTDNGGPLPRVRSEEHTSELQSREKLVC